MLIGSGLSSCSANPTMCSLCRHGLTTSTWQGKKQTPGPKYPASFHKAGEILTLKLNKGWCVASLVAPPPALKVGSAFPRNPPLERFCSGLPQKQLSKTEAQVKWGPCAQTVVSGAAAAAGTLSIQRASWLPAQHSPWPGPQFIEAPLDGVVFEFST